MALTWKFWAQVLGALLIANAAFMEVAPQSWYWAVPGVAEDGPFNAHFIRDIGAAYFVAGVALFAAPFGWRISGLTAGAAFLSLHALIHAGETMFGSRTLETFPSEFFGVYLLPPVAILLARRARHKS